MLQGNTERTPNRYSCHPSHKGMRIDGHQAATLLRSYRPATASVCRDGAGMGPIADCGHVFGAGYAEGLRAGKFGQQDFGI